MKEATEKCRIMVKEKKDLIIKMSEKLMEKETLDLNDIISILGKRPFKNQKSFEDYLKIKEEKKEEV